MKQYEKYKDSGIEWIGEIPEQWEMKRAKQFTNILTGSTPKSNEYTFWNGNIYWVTTDDLGKLKGKDIIDTRRKISSSGYENSGTYLAPINSIVLSSRAPIGHLGKLNVEACTNQGCKTLVANNNFDSDYLFYFLYAGKDFLNSLGVGTTFTELTTQSLKDCPISFPPLREQTAIANYLDHKTAEIDDLVAKKEQLLKLYEEEKTAIINQAVTKGINPDVKMKDSGIEWLGEIPAHWEVKKLKYLGIIKYGLGQPPKQKYDGLPLIRATNIFSGKIDEKDMIYVDPDDIPYDRDPVLKNNDIIVVRSGAYTADSAIIPTKYEGAITGYDMVFRSHPDYNPLFISYCLLSNYVLRNQLLLHTLRAAQPHLNREELGETQILLPNKIEEQTEVVNFIKKETARIDAKIVRTKKLVALQKEYRTALISEVVTGKIKIIQEFNYEKKLDNLCD